MSYQLENINNCTKKLKFNYENLDLNTQIKEALQKKQKEVELKGFRKGKAPLDVVEKLYRGEIESDALNRFIQKEYFDSINKENLKAVSYPMFENMKYESGKSLSFETVVEIFPEFELKEMKHLEFKKDKVEVTDEEVEKTKKSYLESKAQLVAIENEKTALAKGHSAVINFQGVKEDGERPENMKGQEFVLEIGQGQFIPGFEDGMIGMKKGEKRNVKVTFPAEYQAKDLQNAKVTFEIELLEIKEKVYPDFTDELAKEFQFESVQDFMTKTKKNMLLRKERASKEKLHQEVLKKLVEENPFDLPKSLIARQEEYLREDLKRNLKQQGFNDKMVEDYFIKWKDDLEQKAIFQVRSGLILDKIAVQANIEVADKDFDAKIEETAQTSGIDKEQLKKYYTSSEEVKRNVMFAIREEKTFDSLIAQLKVK